MWKKVLVWLSGWVDSAVSAYLLQKDWYEVSAWFMKNYVSDDENCPTKEDRDMAIKVAEQLWIKIFMIFDFRKEYDEKIVEYIYDSYKKWITPNPDIMCNKEIKFKLFLDKAMDLWFNYIATWHYAQIEKDEKWEYILKKWVDENKDQSYFLAWLNQEQLSKSLFPIWNICKTKVREIANQVNLINANRKDSQGICFIWKVDMHKFLEKKLPIKSWDIINTKWEKIWTHNWAHFFTIGQRKWINIWWWPALFVVKKDIDKNQVIVWEEKELDLYSKELETINWHWIWEKYSLPLKAMAKIRYRQKDQELEIFDNWVNSIKAVFKEEQRAISSWQTIAVYMEDKLIWSWIIK